MSGSSSASPSSSPSNHAARPGSADASTVDATGPARPQAAVPAPPVDLNVEQAVRERYTSAARDREPALCCPVDYDSRFLEVLPQELIDRDYGCGDPSKYLRPGEVVLDLGSGGGKICYIASQVVGPEGAVIGVDCNPEMLELARKYQQQIGDRIGHHNTRFLKGSIQDLSLDLARFEAYLAEQPIASSADWLKALAHADQLRRQSPLVASESVDVIVSNCVLNLVTERDRYQLFEEMHRVLRTGGRAVISDIVSDEPVPESLKQDPKLWSGCLSGAFEESAFLQAFADAGFYGIEIVERQSEPWAVIEGIEFRSTTVRAFRGKEGPCKEHYQAAIYRGPFEQVADDDGHVFRRGERTAICDKTFRILSAPPYAECFELVAPSQPIDTATAEDFDCTRESPRHPRETKGQQYKLTMLPESDCCGPGECCG